MRIRIVTEGALPPRIQKGGLHKETALKKAENL